MADELDLFEAVERWADAQTDVHAVAVVGSHARRDAGPTSDVDLVIVVDDVERRLGDRSWLSEFGEVEDVSREDWGLVQSLRVGYRDGLEVEFGLTSRQWAAPPLDPGTAAVIRDGLRILFDPDRLLTDAGRAAEISGEPVRRQSAKVVLVDSRDRVLLFCGHDPDRPDGTFWFPPGGAVKPDETVKEAARREVLEEVGLDLTGRDLGDVVLRRKSSFVVEGVTYEQDEYYFTVRVDQVDVDRGGWTDQEHRAITTHRWWTLQEVMATDETIYPEELGHLLERMNPEIER